MIEKLADAFMRAPIEDNGWDFALRLMAEHTGSARGQLVAFGNDNTMPFNHVTDITDRWTTDFLSIDGGSPKSNWRIACARSPFEIVHESHYRQARVQLKSDAYDDFVQSYDMLNGCQTVLAQDTSMFFGLATLRTARDGITTEDQRSLFASSARFALTAVKMQIALEHKAASLLSDTFNAMDISAFLFDTRGKVIATSLGADRLLTSQNSPLRLIEKRLTARQFVADRALQQALKNSLQNLNSQPSRIWLPGEHVLDGHICDLFQLPRNVWSFGNEPRQLLVVRESRRRTADETALLKSVLGLTSAEAEVALLLADGTSREEISQLRETTQNTVNTQMKNLFRKADVNRETQLVSCLASILAKP